MSARGCRKSAAKTCAPVGSPARLRDLIHQQERLTGHLQAGAVPPQVQDPGKMIRLAAPSPRETTRLVPTRIAPRDGGAARSGRTAGRVRAIIHNRLLARFIRRQDGRQSGFQYLRQYGPNHGKVCCDNDHRSPRCPSLAVRRPTGRRQDRRGHRRRLHRTGPQRGGRAGPAVQHGPSRGRRPRQAAEQPAAARGRSDAAGVPVDRGATREACAGGTSPDGSPGA